MATRTARVRDGTPLLLLCVAWRCPGHGIVQDVQTALKACARCCQGVTPLSSVSRQRPQSSRCDVCERGASGERCVSSSLHVLSRTRRCSAGLWHRVWPTACRCRLLSSLALAFAAHTLCHRAQSRKNVHIHDISTDSLHLRSFTGVRGPLCPLVGQ